MMRSLRAQLFVAILGAVLLAVGVSLAIGIVLTRDAARDALAENLSRDADLLAARFEPLRGGALQGIVGPAELPAPGPGRRGRQVEPPPPVEPGRFTLPVPPHLGGPDRGLPPILGLEEAASILPEDAGDDLREGGSASGTVDVDGERQRFEARRVGDAVALVTRPEIVGGDAFGDYLSGLLIASGLGALLAAAVAALVSRRLAAPLARVAGASRVLAAGGSPEPLPRERTEELASLADAFNEMAAQLARAREAERSVLLSVSHDLRTPMTAIRGYAEGIEDGTIEPRQAAVVVARESRRLERLVDDLLALARLRQGILEVRREPVALGEVLREAEERLRPQAEAAGVELRLESNGDGRVIGDHGRALQVATNLVENAVRVTPAGGRVSLAAAQSGFSVSDSGPGIPHEELNHAFERFRLRDQLGRGSSDGAGLGLAIVKELVEAMGGGVAVESAEGRGARFTVRLPPE